MTLLDEYNQAIIFNNTIILIVVTHNLIIFLYHCVIVQKHSGASSRIPWLSIFPVTTQLILTIYIIFNDWHLHLLSCEWALKLGLVCWWLAKISLYVFYSERLFMVFDNSEMAFKKSTITLTRIAWIIWSISMFVSILILAEGHYDSNTKSCVISLPGWVNAFGLIIDLFICLTLSILFARRMLSLIFVVDNVDKSAAISQYTTDKSTDDSDNNANEGIQKSMRNLSLLKLLSKCTSLTFIGLVTTQFSLLLSSIIGLDGMFVSIDCMINCWCVVLMFSKYKKVYLELFHCNRMESCFTFNCLSCYSCHCCCKIQLKQNLSSNKSVNIVDSQSKSNSSLSPHKSEHIVT